jgi:hypothetical protein
MRWTRMNLERQRWWMVVFYATAMAYVEAAVVAYLRVFLDRIDPYQPYPLAGPAWLGHVEMLREAATLAMLWAVGWLAGTTWHSRLGYALLAFGMWDILYYMFLVPLTGWPHTVLDWDILFLLPLPWWGPVLAPMSIAALMIVGGTILAQYDARPHLPWPRRPAWILTGFGIVLSLYAFMADALRVMSQGEDALRQLLPTRFNWPLFLLAWGLMASPILDVWWQHRRTRSVQHAS